MVIIIYGDKMQIVKYNKVKNNIYEVYIKGNNKPINLFDKTILKFDLLIKKNITKEELAKIKEYNYNLEAYYIALKYIGRKLRTKLEIINYLKNKDFSLDVINKSVAQLEKEGYLNDQDYIKAYIKDQITLSLNGPDKIRNNLLKLGLIKDDIDQELAKVDSIIWHLKLKKIIAKRLKTNKDSCQSFILKTTKYLQSNGYNKVLYNDILNNIKIEDNSNFIKQANNLYKKLQRKCSNEELYFVLKNKLYSKGYNTNQINEFIEKIKKES